MLEFHRQNEHTKKNTLTIDCCPSRSFLWALMIYCFCLRPALKAVFSSFLCLSDPPQRTKQRRRGSSRAQSAVERSSTMSTRRSNRWRICWWETHNPSLNTLLCSDWAPIGVEQIHFWGLWRSVLVWQPLCLCCPASACPLISLFSQTLKDYQRRLDTSGLKPSNELYTEYKVRLQSTQTSFVH